MELKKIRDKRVDILRCIALIGIVIAHSGPGPVLFQFRNFDVVLMVMLLGTSFFLSNASKTINYLEYLKKRFVRLVVPAWIFLTCFFVLYFIVSIILGDSYYFDIKQIIGSYAMLDGIGYVWILRVFMIIAVISPLLLYISKSIKSNKFYFIVLCVLYGIYTIFILFDKVLDDYELLHQLYEKVFLYAIGYGLIAALGIRLKQFKRTEIIALNILFVIIFIVLAFYHNFSQTQNFKYPPTMYYISYGLAVGLGLYLILEWKPIYNILNNRLVNFLSVTSLRFYFWHIIPIYIIQLFSSQIPLLHDSFIVRLLFISSTAFLLTYLQEVISIKIKSKKSSTQFLVE